MSVITFMSDFGERDHYVAVVKGIIYSLKPDVNLIDISHDITPFDIGHAAHIAQQVYPHYPTSSVHILAIDPVKKETSEVLAAEIDSQYFVSYNSGIFQLISNQQPSEIVRVGMPETTFSARELLAKTAVEILINGKLNGVGNPTEEIQSRTARLVKATKKEIVGHVVHIDHFGNLITNITREDYETIQKLLGGKATISIRFAREVFSKFHSHYYDVDDGDCFVLFNASGFLEIGINKGRACDLLGLKQDTPVVIEFNS